MKCPQCQFDNPVNAKFCNECGVKQELRCPVCRSLSHSSNRFCDHCGHPIKKPLSILPIDYSKPQTYTPRFLAEKILNTRTAIEGERKIVTVLFIDVAKSTRIFENLDPEEVHDIMDGCFKITMDEVHRYEGTINQFRGDGVMALFGAPIAHEDDSHRACSAALSIQKALNAYGKKLEVLLGVEFKVRIGLNSGPVVVGKIGDDLRMDYTADGDTVNLASRLETMAAPGSILVSSAIINRVRESFEFQSLGKVKIRGKKEPQEIFQLATMKDKAGKRPDLMIYSDIVGRELELNRLELNIDKAKKGEGSIVSIIGEAGVGKSRLIEELKKRGTMESTFVLEGRSLSMGRNLSFHPLTQMIKNWAFIQEKDSETETIAKLESALRKIHPEQVQEIFPFIATMMGINLSGKYSDRLQGIEGEALEILIQKNLIDLITRASELSTLIFVIEDVHWADTSSIELLIKLFRLAEDHRIIFINIFRPHHRDTSEKLLNAVIENYPNLHTEIYAQPLDVTQSNLLVDNLLEAEGLPYYVRDLIHQRSAGNPLFIEELVRSFIDKGLVNLKHGKFTIDAKIKSAIIPNTIQELLMSRIDRLDEQAKFLLKIAAVIGRTFFYSLLAEVAQKIGNIDDKLGDLQAMELIQKDDRRDEIEYFFRHALVQETAYESILRQTRKELHLSVAECAERIYRERLHEFYGMLAFHYSSGENIEKTEEYLIKAGEEALKSSASNEALGYYQGALDLYLDKYEGVADPEKIEMLEKNIALALYNRGQYIEAVDYFDRALTHYWGELPQRMILIIPKFLLSFSTLAIALYLPSLKFKFTPTQLDKENIDLFYKKLEVLSIVNPKRFFFESFHLLKRVSKFNLYEVPFGVGIIMSASGLFSFTGLSFKLSRKTLDFSEQRLPKGDTRQFFQFKWLKTINNYLEGNWKAIEPYDNDLVNTSLNLGGIWEASQYLYWQGFAEVHRGSFATAKSIVNKLNHIFEVYRNKISLALKYELNASLLLESHRYRDALAEIEIGIEFAQKADLKHFLIEMYSCKTLTHLMMGDSEDARITLQYANKFKRQIDLVPFQQSSFCRCRFYYDLLQLEKTSDAGTKPDWIESCKKAYRSGQNLLKVTHKSAQHRTDSYRLMGIYYWLINKPQKAIKWWHKSILEGERLGARPQLSCAYREVGKRLLVKDGDHNGIEAEIYLEKARALFKEMDLRGNFDEFHYVVEA